MQVNIARINRAIDNDTEVIPEGANVVDLSEVLKTDPEGWTNEKANDFTRNEDGSVSFKALKTDTRPAYFYYTNKTYPINTLYKFKMNANTNNYIAMMVGSQRANCIPWRTDNVNSYYIIIKKNAFEVQKRINNEQCFLIDAVPNTQFTFDEWHDVSIGTFLEDGVVRVIINVDGKNMVDLKDNINYTLSGASRALFTPNLDMVTDPGYLGFMLASNGSAKYHISLK